MSGGELAGAIHEGALHYFSACYFRGDALVRHETKGFLH
jgi:hypothetical protein